MKPSVTRITLAALCLTLSAPLVLAEDKKTADEGAVVTGNPPADSPFAKIKPGMTFKDAVAVLGKPTAERAFCTGKHHIPFYFARDRAYTEYYYQNQGVVVFYTDVSVGGWSRYKSCSPTEPTEVAEVHFNASEPGVAPKEGEERPKAQTQAAN
mgnify:CR=1 FL=1